MNQYERYGRPKFWGGYVLTSPALILNDPEMIKQVVTKAFDHFVNRNHPKVGEIMSGKSVRICFLSIVTKVDQNGQG